MEGLRPTTPDVVTEYQPMRSCDSDDSQSNASRSEDNEAIPGIIYTSDDSADVGQSDSTYVDSDIPNYIAQNVNPKMEDELSQQFLLESDLAPSPQPSPHVDDPFVPHPLSQVNLARNIGTPKEIGANLDQTLNPLYADHPKVHLQVNPSEVLDLTRSNSTSSSSTEPEFTTEAPYITQYAPLSMYAEDEQFAEDEQYAGGLKFDAMNDDPIKSQVIHQQLSTLTNSKDSMPKKKNGCRRFYVGNVPIDARYKDAFFVSWNWPRIRQTCVFVNLSFLIAFLCVGIGLIIKMPQGSECNPKQEWWQGSTMYHIFVPSFQDTDGNGFGDISGVISRLDYLQGLGVKTLRLASIFHTERFLDEKIAPLNYTEVASVLGDTRDLHLLAALLHERDMYLLLDVPLARETEPDGKVMPSIDLEESVPFVLSHWMNFGVDGFAFPDLHKLSLEHSLVMAMHKWRNRLDAKSRGLERKVMSVPIGLLKKFETSTSLQALLGLVDLIDVRLDLNQPAEDVAIDINEATRWDDHSSLPWINWRIGGPFEPRISDLTKGLPISEDVPALGFSLLHLFLPGTSTLYYGDELGSTQGDDFKRDLSWATPMTWNADVGGGFTKGSPWLALGEDWKYRNVAVLNDSLASLRTLVKASQEEVPLYINGIFEDIGGFHPTKATNYKIRYASDNLFIMDRFYPRRNKYAIVINLGQEPVERDLSRHFFGGKVLASSHGKVGYVRFSDIRLQPREALALVLDK